MTESKELRAARALYMAKLTKHVALSIPPSIHYTAGYKAGSAILLDVANTCAEAERRLAAAEARYKELHNAARRCLRYAGIDPAKFNEAMRHMDALIQRHIAEIKGMEDGE